MQKKKQRNRAKAEDTFLTYLDSAERVILERNNGKPMHYRQITRIAIELNYLNSKAKKPESIMSALLHRDIGNRASKNKEKRFIHVSPGLFGLGNNSGLSESVNPKQADNVIKPEKNRQKNSRNTHLDGKDVANKTLQKVGNDKPFYLRESTKIANKISSLGEIDWNSAKAEIPIYASRVREARRYVGLKSADAAEFLGVSTEEYSEIENHRPTVNMGKLVKLAQLYSRPIQYFSRKRKLPYHFSIIHSDGSIISKHDMQELLNFAEFLSASPKQKLKANNLEIFTQNKSGNKGVQTAIEFSRKLSGSFGCSHGCRADVFGVVQKLGLLLLFRPLENLCSALVQFEGKKGILLNSERPSDVQRLAAACELGQILLNHRKEWENNSIFPRSQFKNIRKIFCDPGNEDEALVFASNFLLNKKHMLSLMEIQGWDVSALADPANIYQASLRFGTSYEATIYGLEREKLISNVQRENLLKVTPQSLKRDLWSKSSLPDSTCSEIWELTENDNGLVLEVGLNDVLLFKLKETPSTGYLWNFDELNQKELAILEDTRIPFSKKTVGSPVERFVYVKTKKPLSKPNLQIQRKQSWKGGELGKTLSFQLLSPSMHNTHLPAYPKILGNR